MRRKFGLPIIIGFALLTLTSLTSCSLIEDYILNHEHIWTDYYVTDNETHWKECQYPLCNERLDYQYHYSTTSSCTLKPYCEICGDVYGEPDTHDFSIPVIEDKYFAGTYDETGKPEFYYLCHCGEVSTEAKPYSGHYIYYKGAVSPTCTENGSEAYYACYHCPNIAYTNKQGTDFKYISEVIIPQLGHYWDSSLSFNDESHYNTCLSCNLKENITKHDFTNVIFQINKNLTYGESYTSKDIDVYASCDCGYSQQIKDKKELYIESHVLKLGDNKFEVMYNGVVDTITYNPSNASNNHDDWVNNYHSGEYVIEGVVTTVLKLYSNSYDFTILDKDGYGYYVFNPTTFETSLSVGDYVQVKAKKEYHSDYEYVLAYGSYIILDDKNETSLDKSYFVDATKEFKEYSVKEFANRYRFVPIMIKEIKFADYGYTREIYYGYDKSAYSLELYSSITNELEEEINYRACIGSVDATLYGFYFSYYSIQPMSGTIPFEYTGYLSDDQKYNVDVQIVDHYLYNVYRYAENCDYVLPNALFSNPTYSLYYYNEGVTLNGNVLSIGEVMTNFSFEITATFNYDYSSPKQYYWVTAYTKEDHDFSYFYLNETDVYDYESSFGVIGSTEKLLCDSFKVYVESAYDENGMSATPSISFDGTYMTIKPVDYITVTNDIKVELYYGSETYSKTYKYTTIDNRYTREYLSVDLTSLSCSSGLVSNDIGNNGGYSGLRVQTSNCYTSSNGLVISPGGYVRFYGRLGFLRIVEASIDTNNSTYIYSSLDGNYYNYYIYDDNNYSYSYYHYIYNDQPVRNVKIYNNSSNDITITYAYSAFLTYKTY